MHKVKNNYASMKRIRILNRSTSNILRRQGYIVVQSSSNNLNNIKNFSNSEYTTSPLTTAVKYIWHKYDVPSHNNSHNNNR